MDWDIDIFSQEEDDYLGELILNHPDCADVPNKSACLEGKCCIDDGYGQCFAATGTPQDVISDDPEVVTGEYTLLQVIRFQYESAENFCKALNKIIAPCGKNYRKCRMVFYYAKRSGI